MTNDEFSKISYSDFTIMSAAGFVVDGTKGGLVIGPSHKQGGIKILYDDGACYRISGELEGFEFVVNHAATYLLRNRFDELNEHDIDNYDLFEPYEIPAGITVLNTEISEAMSFIKGLVGSKYIVFEFHQMVLNRQATKDRLAFINALNQRFTFTYDSEKLSSATKGFIIDNDTRETIHEYPITLNLST